MYNRRERNVDHFCHMISGYFMPDDEIPGAEGEDDDLEEEEEDIQFLNYSEMNGIGQGKQLYEGRKMKCCKGVLKDLNRPNRSDQVTAPFHFTDPWWKICMLRTRVVDHQRCPKDNTSLTYEIRTDDKVVKEKLVTMFFTKHEQKEEKPNPTNNELPVHDGKDYIDKFLQFIAQNGMTKRLKFENLEELLNDYMNSFPEDGKMPAEILIQTLNSSDWACISKALKFPKLVSVLSQILPMQFKSIMENPKSEGLVRDLSRALDLTPWIFGFKKLLNKDFDLVGCEASLLSIQRAEIFNQLEQVHKDALVIYDFLKTDSRQKGHTQISLVKLKERQKGDCREFDEALKFLKRNKIIKELEIEDDTKICLQQLYNYERKISDGIRNLYKQQLEDPWELEVDLESVEFERIREDKEQLLAAKMLLKYPVVVISGKGGCGKTTVVTKVLSYESKNKENDKKRDKKEEWEEEMSQVEDYNWNDYKLSQKNRDNVDDPDFPDTEMFHNTSASEEQCAEDENDMPETEEDSGPDIIYTAPTGKAANLLGRRANTTGYTLHQIIWSYRFFVSKMKKEDPDAKWKYRSVKTLVVDECSMVAVSTFSTLLTTLMENSILRRIVLLGDVRQLPSIEPGNFLADVYRSLYPVKSSIELMTNHRAESKLIIENATAISLMRYPLFSAEHKFSLHEVPQSEDRKNDMHDIVVQRILKQEESLKDDKKSQFITFTNKYCDWINEHACKIYNNHPTRNHKNKLDFVVKDKICLKKNGMVTVYEQDDRGNIKVKYIEGELEPEEAADVMEVTLMSQTLNGTSMTQTVNQSNRTQSEGAEGTNRTEKKKKTMASIRLCNGEIYFIKDEKNIISNRGKETRYLKFSDEDPDGPREFWVNYREVMRKCRMRHSWARTIHTFQGSECENVVYVVGFCPLQNWQHVYTAVTRGKKAVHIVGTKQHLRKSIQKEADTRNTTLHHQIKETLPVEQILDELVSKDDIEVSNGCSGDKQNFTVLKEKRFYSEPSTSNVKPSTSTPIFKRNGILNILPKKQSLQKLDCTEEQVHSPFSDSQWSDYGDETYLEATQVTKPNQVNENSFDLMESLDMTENSEVLGDLTTACELLEASMALENQQKSIKNHSKNSETDQSFLKYQTKENKQTKGSNSSADSISIDEFDSFSSSPSKRNSRQSCETTPKKQKLSNQNVVSPARKMLTQLTFK